MCFVLYVGTDSPLSRIPFDKDAPNLSVESLKDRDRAIAQHFTKPEVQYVGSRSRCGCDFPHRIVQNRDIPLETYALIAKKAPGRLESARFNREALAKLLPASGEKSVEVYSV